MLHVLWMPVAAVVMLAVAASGHCVARFPLSDVGDPWGTTIDGAGNLWFAEGGCDFEVNCTAATPPGQLGVLHTWTNQLHYYTLPDVPGNQPIFVEADPAGHIWFTTPNNSMIGEFDVVTETFVGQWPVTPGTGPWDLVFADGAVWYTQRFASAVGRFDPVTHEFVNYLTPTPDTHPYGIAARGSTIWFAENNGAIAQIGMLDTAAGGVIQEYDVRAAVPGSLTPHMISIDDSGNVWWSGGFVRVIGKLDPAVAQPGECGVAFGNCLGVTEYELPAPPDGCSSHVSGIAAQPARARVWLTDSLSGEVGYLDTSTGDITLYQPHDCNAHPHDGLSVDRAGHVWWTEEFADTLNTFTPPE